MRIAPRLPARKVEGSARRRQRRCAFPSPAADAAILPGDPLAMLERMTGLA